MRHPLAPVLSEIDLANTHATIDLAQLRTNLQHLRRVAGTAPVMAVVKADAYGHGAVPVARELAAAGVSRFAVATVPEALALRAAGVEGQILVFGAPLPHRLPLFAAYGLDVTVSSPAVAEAVIALAEASTPLRVHVKVETGMGRIGVVPAEAPAVIEQLRRAPGVELVGVWTHFAQAGEQGGQTAARQLERLRSVLAASSYDGLVHVAASDAVLNVPASLRGFARTLVRSGISLYGYGRPDLAEQTGVRPVMTFTSRVTHLKTVEAGTPISYGGTWTAPTRRRIATLGAGYADGYPRLLSNRSQVTIGGRRYPVAGIVCMDMFMVDLGQPGGDGDHVQVGDTVVLFGPDGPTARDLAAWAETIPYEICCGIGPRVVRRYLGASDAP